MREVSNKSRAKRDIKREADSLDTAVQKRAQKSEKSLTIMAQPEPQEREEAEMELETDECE